MAKIIFTSRYYRNPAGSNVGKLLRYIATRDGVEKMPNGIDTSKPATVRQQRLIHDIVKCIPSTAQHPEYASYQATPTKSAASEFIAAVIERNMDEIDKSKHLVRYMAERPGVEKLGAHGLFSQTDDKIDLDAVCEDVSQHDGIVFTHVISLRREDAERLGFNEAEAWRDLVRRNAIQIAQAHKIPVSDLTWYAAFHNTTHHPHIHLMVYSKKPQQGWLTKKGINDMRRLFGNDIFRNEQYKLFQMETQQRDAVKYQFRKQIEYYQTHPYSVPEPLALLFQKLSVQLHSVKGKKMYGYLPKDVKNTVDDIVRELAKTPEIASLYLQWNVINREKLSLYYDKKDADIPLEDNREFRSVKNAIIREAETISSSEPSRTQTDTSLMLGRLIARILQIISDSYRGKEQKLHGQIDSKLRSKIAQKKAAHGIRTSHNQSGGDQTMS